MKKIKYFLIVTVLMGFFGIFVLLISNLTILTYKTRIIPAEKVEPTEIALVFGGGMKDDGSMTEMQYDRVVKAVELYKAGKVNKLFMTGDDGTARADEVNAMKQMAVDRGVLETDVEIDGKSYNTYKSCYRIKNVFEVDKVVAISQTFHLSRILYFCRDQGVETVGVAADLRDYGVVGNFWVKGIRETLAKLKGWWQVEFFPPKLGY